MILNTFVIVTVLCGVTNSAGTFLDVLISEFQILSQNFILFCAKFSLTFNLFKLNYVFKLKIY